jgi:predicted acetyltransferase
MTEFREPIEADRAQIVDLTTVALQPSPGWAEHVAPTLPLEEFLCAYEGDRMVACARSIPVGQWFGGRSIPMAGISMVATAPEHRGKGIVTETMRRLLVNERERGALISALYPATVPLYRRLGYEYGGVFTEYTASLSELPRGDPGRVELFEGDDFRELRACYGRVAPDHNGWVDAEDDNWWRFRVLRRWGKETISRAVVVPGPDGVEGYAAFVKEIIDGRHHRLVCSHLVGETPEALDALLGYFRRFRSITEEIRWRGAPNEPLALLLPEQNEKPSYAFRFMLRLLDVPAALEARGYPEVEGEAVITVTDDLFPGNDGSFRLVAESGKVRVERTEPGRSRPMSIGHLSALFSGHVSPADLIRAGALDRDDPAIPFFARLFAGPPPWSMDFF